MPGMSAARIIHVPLSGRDRKHFARELHKAEQTYDLKRREADAAHTAADSALRQAHRLDCEAWSALQFIGGSEAPSPSIGAAIHGGCELLEVECRHCNHADFVDLAEVTWPRSQPVHTLRKALYRRPCLQTVGKKRRPALVGLRVRPEPEPAAPAQRKRGGRA
jgi:hypothetical protein